MYRNIYLDRDWETNNSNTFTKTETLSDVITYIDSLSGFSATLQDSVLSSYPAFTLLNCSEFVTPTTTGNVNYIYLDCAVNQMSITKINEAGMYSTSHYVGRVKTYYKAGYDEIPSAIQLAAMKAVVNIFWTFATKGAGVYKSEKVGSYSYTLGDVSSQSISEASIAQLGNAEIMSLLAPYKLKKI